MADRDLQQLSEKFAKDGKLLEAGWLSFRALDLCADISAEQICNMRLAWMSSAWHLFKLMSVNTDDDVADTLQCMQMIDKELAGFFHEMVLKFQEPAGSA